MCWEGGVRISVGDIGVIGRFYWYCFAGFFGELRGVVMGGSWRVVGYFVVWFWVVYIFF